MSKISYEIFGNIGELSGYERDGSDITFSIKGADALHLSIGAHSYEIINGSVTVPRAAIPDGVHIPRLVLKRGQVLLPLISVSGNHITFPDKENISHALSLRLSRQNARLTALEKELRELREYIRGSTCF